MNFTFHIKKTTRAFVMKGLSFTISVALSMKTIAINRFYLRRIMRIGNHFMQSIVNVYLTPLCSQIELTGLGYEISWLL